MTHFHIFYLECDVVFSHYLHVVYNCPFNYSSVSSQKNPVQSYQYNFEISYLRRTLFHLSVQSLNWFYSAGLKHHYESYVFQLFSAVLPHLFSVASQVFWDSSKSNTSSTFLPVCGFSLNVLVLLVWWPSLSM